MSDMSNMETTNVEFIRNVTQIASAYLGKNSVPASELPDLIRRISSELKSAIGEGNSITVKPVSATTQIDAVAPEAATQVIDVRRMNLPTVPVLPISQSIKANTIVCLFDGVEKKSLKRYLRAQFGMEADEYRAYWKLPADYPMVAPSYSEEKRRVAKDQGLGTAKIDKTPRAVRTTAAPQSAVA
jgi:predicted transcriptional regulator